MREFWHGTGVQQQGAATKPTSTSLEPLCLIWPPAQTTFTDPIADSSHRSGPAAQQRACGCRQCCHSSWPGALWCAATGNICPVGNSPGRRSSTLSRTCGRMPGGCADPLQSAGPRGSAFSRAGVLAACGSPVPGEDAGRDAAALFDLKPLRFDPGAYLGVADAARGSLASALACPPGSTGHPPGPDNFPIEELAPVVVPVF
jgi:hypothetical protein